MTPAEFTAWREALGGRRFMLTIGSGIVNTGLVIAGKIGEGTFRDLILGTVGAYILGATYQTVKNYAVGRPPEISPPVPVGGAASGPDRPGV